MKIEINYSTILKEIWQKKFVILFYVFLFWQLYLLKYDLNSVKFLPRLVSLIFIGLSLNAVLFTIFFLIYRKKDFYKPAAFALLFSDIAIFTTINYPQIYDYFGVILDTLLVKHIIPVHFVGIAVSDGNLFWALMLGLYISIFLFVYGNWFVRNKKIDDGFWKIERQFFYTGLGLYGILVPFIFIFTHFTFVGSNYMYMEGLLKYTDKIVSIYDKNNTKEIFQLKDLKYFNSLKEVVTYYESALFKNRIVMAEDFKESEQNLHNPQVERKRIISGDNKGDFYYSAIDKLEKIKKEGFKQKEKLTYSSITRFHDWIQVAYNVSFDGIDSAERKMWYLEITPTIIKAKEEQEDVLRHSILYIKEAKNGGYYVYFTLDRVFKDHKMNYIFNFFFVLFHLLYIGFFIYLLKIHQKKNLSKKYKEVF